MAKGTTRPMMKGGRIVREPVAAKATASTNRKTTASGDGATNTAAPASGSITATGGRSPTRQSNRIRGSGPAAIEGLDTESRLGRELSSQLIQNPEATRKRREKEAKKNGLSGKGNAKYVQVPLYYDVQKFGPLTDRRWMGAWEPEVPDDDNNEESDKEAEQQSNDTPADAGGKKVAIGSKKRKAPAGTNATESSRPSKKARKTGPSRRNQNSSETPPDDGGGGGDDDPDDEAQRAARGPPRNPDEKFLRTCIDELRLQEPDEGTWRRGNTRKVLSVLRQVRQPIDDRVQRFANILPEEEPSKPDCCILDAAEAKRLLESNTDVEAPVFVPNGAREDLFNGSMVRPIEQVLRTWYIDINEQTTVGKSLEQEKTGHFKEHVTIRQVRERFLGNEPERLHPWNLPDMLNPRLEHCVPHFMQSLNCNLLQDVVRRALDATASETCPENCPNARTDRLGCTDDTHKLTRKEFHALKENSVFWPGTVMLAEPGAVTTSHSDSWCLGTWISCHEGQIGLVWRSHPTDEEMRHQLEDSGEAEYHLEGTSIYKVLRPGDAVYVPSGTIHTVFRKPSGNQTLGLAGHIVRRSAAAAWLRLLNIETLDTANNWRNNKDDECESVVPPLARALRALMGRQQREGRAGLFGGRDHWRRADTQLQALEETVTALQTAALNDASTSPRSSSGPNAEGGPEDGEEEADRGPIIAPPKRPRRRKAAESEAEATSSTPAAKTRKKTRKGEKK